MLDTIQQAGVVATIIFLLMGAAIKWLLGQLEKSGVANKELNEKVTGLLEQRAVDLERRGDEYHQFADTQTRAWESKMQAWDVKLDLVMSKLDMAMSQIRDMGRS